MLNCDDLQIANTHKLKIKYVNMTLIWNHLFVSQSVHLEFSQSSH